MLKEEINNKEGKSLQLDGKSENRAFKLEDSIGCISLMTKDNNGETARQDHLRDMIKRIILITLILFNTRLYTAQCK